MTVLTEDVKVETPPVVVEAKAEVKSAADILFPPAKVEEPKKEGEAAKVEEVKDPLKSETKPEDTPKEPEKKPEDQPLVYDLKVPEGATLAKTSVDEFVSVAKEMKLPPEQAQKLVDWYAKHNGEAAATQAKAWETTVTGWAEQAKTDKDFGGAKFDASLKEAKATLGKFGNKEFTEALNITGMGNHPEMVRFLVKVAKAMGEDKPVDGTLKGSGEVKDIAKILFPTHN